MPHGKGDTVNSDRGRAAKAPEAVKGIKPNYEAAMRVTYDERRRCVTIEFRGSTKTFATQLPPEGAIRAGEEYCKSMGWDPAVQLLLNTGRLVPPLRAAALRTR
jgi:hypothetical protein